MTDNLAPSDTEKIRRLRRDVDELLRRRPHPTSPAGGGDSEWEIVDSILQTTSAIEDILVASGNDSDMGVYVNGGGISILAEVADGEIDIVAAAVIDTQVTDGPYNLLAADAINLRAVGGAVNIRSDEDDVHVHATNVIDSDIPTSFDGAGGDYIISPPGHDPGNTINGDDLYLTLQHTLGVSGSESIEFFFTPYKFFTAACFVHVTPEKNSDTVANARAQIKTFATSGAFTTGVTIAFTTDASVTFRILAHGIGGPQ